MGAQDRARRAFDASAFSNDLNRLAARHGVLAIAAYVMVPLDAAHHHVLQAEYGVDQLTLDQLKIAARHPGELEASTMAPL